MTKAHYANDNDDTWQPLSLATRRLLERTEHQEEKDTDGRGSSAQEQQPQRDPDETREYVERRLRDLRQFEKRAKGRK